MLDKFAEALSLLQRGTLYMRQAQVHLKSIESQTSPELTTVKSAMDDVSLLQVRLERSESRTSRDWFEYNLVSGEAVKPQAAGDGALTLAVENISLHKQANGRRAKKPRKIGPVFFDVAFNYIAPVRTDEQAEDLYSDRPGDHGAAFLGDNVEEARTGVDEDARSPSASAQSAGRGIWGFFGMRK